MDDLSKQLERARMMKALMKSGMMQGASSMPMTQHLLRGVNGLSQGYDASDRYDSALLKQSFLENYKKHKNSDYTNWDDDPKPPPRPSIDHGLAPSSMEDLKLVSISDVLKRLNHVHNDCVMLVEVIHAPYRQASGTMVLVKDSSNDIMMVDLYNYVAADENPKELFPVGKKLALVCPFLICTPLHDHLVLRCDNPQFVISFGEEKYIWKEAGSARRLNPSELRKMGNMHFQRGNMDESRNCYSRALKHVDIDSEAFELGKVSCLSNRAEVNLRLERWEDAAEDAQEVLKIQSDHTKARFRLAKAFSRIGKAREARHLLEVLQRSGGDLKRSHEFQELAKDCRRIANEEVGQYNIPSMLKDASKRPGKRLSSFHATYCSPNVAIGIPIPIPSSDAKSYRGCKALANIKEGELVMSSRAFVVALDVPQLWSLREVESQIVRKLWKTPSLGNKLYSLCDGGDSSRFDGNDLDKIDLKRIRGIIRANSFGFNPYDTGIRQAWECLRDSKHQFCFTGPNGDSGEGLWINESMLNHSCTPNCTYSNIGDQIFIHTTKPVHKGEELCVCYFPFFESYEKRFDAFSRWIQPGVGFDCVCDHCDLLRNHDDLRKLADEVYQKVRQVEHLADSNKKSSRVIVAQETFPLIRRQAIISAFSHLPLRLQHTRVAELHELEARVMRERDDFAGALKANQLAANTNFEVRGSGHWDYYKEQWRIAGLAVVCKDYDLARESLGKIWNSPAFQAYSNKEAKEMFWELSRIYVTQQIPMVPAYFAELGKLICLVMGDNTMFSQRSGLRWQPKCA